MSQEENVPFSAKSESEIEKTMDAAVQAGRPTWLREQICVRNHK